MTPGSIVQCRNRDQEDLHLLPALTGATDEVVAIDTKLTELVELLIPR